MIIDLDTLRRAAENLEILSRASREDVVEVVHAAYPQATREIEIVVTRAPLDLVTIVQRASHFAAQDESPGDRLIGRRILHVTFDVRHPREAADALRKTVNLLESSESLEDRTLAILQALYDRGVLRLDILSALSGFLRTVVTTGRPVTSRLNDTEIELCVGELCFPVSTLASYANRLQHVNPEWYECVTLAAQEALKPKNLSSPVS